MGGGTTRVGDPSGKDETRQILTVEQIDANKESIKGVFSQASCASATAEDDALMADNAEWLTKLNYIEMLRDIGRHFSVNRMLTMDSVKLRLERDQEMSFIEFNYMILPVLRFRRIGAAAWLQSADGRLRPVGQHRQRRRSRPPHGHALSCYALTTPLLTTASGAKMGKTAAGAVWLNADLLSPYDYWQYWRNTEDADVERFLKLFTTLPLDEIARLAALQGHEINEAKKVLGERSYRAAASARDAANDAADDRAARLSRKARSRRTLPTHRNPARRPRRRRRRADG